MRLTTALLSTFLLASTAMSQNAPAAAAADSSGSLTPAEQETAYREALQVSEAVANGDKNAFAEYQAKNGGKKNPFMPDDLEKVEKEQVLQYKENLKAKGEN